MSLHLSLLHHVSARSDQDEHGGSGVYCLWSLVWLEREQRIPHLGQASKVSVIGDQFLTFAGVETIRFSIFHGSFRRPEAEVWKIFRKSLRAQRPKSAHNVQASYWDNINLSSLSTEWELH